MAKIYGALEVAQLEWFTDAGKPAPASYIYRVIYVSDLKQVQVSDGTNWIAFLNTSTNQTLAGDITFTGAQIFSGQHRLSVTTNSSTGAIVALAATTPVIEFTGAVTSIAGIASGASGATVMLVNRSGNSFQILDEGSGASASNRIRTGAGSITLANNASVLLTYVGDNRWHVVGGSGSGSGAGGSKNYFALSSANANFAQNTVSPWSAATLTLSGGVPSGAPTLTATQMAIAATATNPLLTSESLYNMQLTKSAANAQGQGFISSVLTIDREDVAKVLTGTFSYEVVSGTIDLSGASTQSLEIWVYNVTANQWIQPAGFRGMNQSSGVGQVTFTFQTDGTAANVQYRVAVITAQTSASAYVVNFNDFKIGPQTVSIGSFSSNWIRYTPTFVGFGSVTNINAYSRRVADSLEVYAQFQTGTTTATIATMSVGFNGANANVTVDTSKVTGNTVIGTGTLGQSSATYFGFYPIAPTSNATTINFGIQNSTTNAQLAANGNVVTSSSYITVHFTVPIVGWDSSMVLSNDTDTRVVAARAFSSVAQSISSVSTTVAFGGVSFDSHGGWISSTQYRIPVSGYYRITASMAFAGVTTSALNINVNVNGTFTLWGAAPNSALTFASAQANGKVYCNAGDIITVTAVQQSPAQNYLTGSAYTYLDLERLSGPSVIAASETVACEYASSAGNSISHNATTFIDFGTRQGDTHNAVLGAGSGNNTTFTNTWRYVVPVSGRYLVQGFVAIQNGATTNNIDFVASIHINGVLNKIGTRLTLLTTQSGAMYTSSVVSEIQLLAGQAISIAAYQANGGSNARTQDPSTASNFVSIVRVGN